MMLQTTDADAISFLDMNKPKTWIVPTTCRDAPSGVLKHGLPGKKHQPETSIYIHLVLWISHYQPCLINLAIKSRSIPLHSNNQTTFVNFNDQAGETSGRWADGKCAWVKQTQEHIGVSYIDIIQGVIARVSLSANSHTQTYTLHKYIHMYIYMCIYIYMHMHRTRKIDHVHSRQSQKMTSVSRDSFIRICIHSSNMYRL